MTMYPRQLEELASQRTMSYRAQPRQATRAVPASVSPSRRTIRKRTGWALVAIGLRLAQSAGQ